jgi:hypothetical protein
MVGRVWRHVWQLDGNNLEVLFYAPKWCVSENIQRKMHQSDNVVIVNESIELVS